MDTIFALASARGKAGVSVIRLSGPDTSAAVRQIAGGLTPPRRASLRTLRDEEGSVLDEALVLRFEAGASFTGEEAAEFQVHGSVATVNAILRRLAGIEGLRPAEAGEFTRRALENDRLDLARVEGLGDLIEAETEAQRRQAMRVFSGALGDKAERWRTDLLCATALLEATIDFADEDVPVDVRPEVAELIDAVSVELKAEQSGIDVAERLRDGFEVAIIGAPNVGKSTLLNYLAGRDAAITSEIAGTTRDVIEVRMDIRGLPVTFLDTAGLRATEDKVEAIGVERTKKRAAESDLRVFLLLRPDEDLGVPMETDDLRYLAKADLEGDPEGISGLTGRGVAGMLDAIAERLEQRVAGVGAATKERHRAAISGALAHLGFGRQELDRGEERMDIAAEELRLSVRALDSLVGRVDVEHVLDEIFSRFCIGK